MIRIANIQDIENLVVFMREVYDDIGTLFNVGFSTKSLDSFFNKFTCNGGLIFLSEDKNNKINGYCFVSFGSSMFDDSCLSMSIVGLYVSKKDRKNGIGKQLIDGSEKLAKEKGIKQIIMDMQKEVKIDNSYEHVGNLYRKVVQ
jgi:ribosomal protein S18 acetylase RimI-like enzyme